MSVTQIARAAAPSKLNRLLNTCPDIGGVYSLTFDDAIVLTNDHAKQEYGGIPRGGWLLASACKGESGNLSLSDEEIVLLRVRDVTPLPNESDLTRGRLGVIRDAHDTQRDFEQVTDAYTRAEHQQSALACDVVGVFYTSVTDPERIEFGAELDNVWSAARYRVFIPSEKALSWIASFPRSSAMIDIGTVRFSATRRNAQRTGRDQARVAVNIEDFIGSKVAVLGLTRSGKSNTIKTIVTAVYRYAAERNTKVGQVIFDPQGEYANVNKQDGTGLRNLGDPDSNHVHVYTASPRKNEPQEHPLRLNFFDTDLFEVAWDMVVGSMEGAEANYVRSFRSADMERPDANDFRAQTHWGRGFMAFYGLLHRAGYRGSFPNGTSINFHMKDETAEAFNKDNGSLALTGKSGVYTCTSPEQAAAVVEFINTLIGAWEKARKDSETRKDNEDAEEKAARLEGLVEAWTRSDQFIAVADVFKYAKGRGIAGLRELREFHDPNGRGEIAEMVWDDMVHGRISIIDLSIGSDTVAKVMSERLVTGLVNRASSRFRANEDPIPFQIIVEEAHNLFERGRSVKDDPWVRMSKEAAKYKIGLVYATQEVTSVDQKILSNTHNWIVAHLNSQNETRELAKYYNFEDFADSIRRSEDRGYVRLKTASSPYIIPVQILLFGHAMINAARYAAGLGPIPGGDDDQMLAEIAAPSAEPDFAAPAPAPAAKKTAAKKTTAKKTAQPRLSALGDGEF